MRRGRAAQALIGARTDAIFALHPILHLSGSEAGALSGRDGLDDALLALHERTQAPIIATVGALGARVLLDKDTLLTVPGYPSSSVVDTIGAGRRPCGRGDARLEPRHDTCGRGGACEPRVRKGGRNRGSHAFG